MAKLTKPQRKAHAEAEAILTKDRLTEDEKDFVFQNWHEGANHINGTAGGSLRLGDRRQPSPSMPGALVAA